MNSNIECENAFAVSFADPPVEVYKFHSLLGSAGELSGDKLSSPSLQSHLWNLLKSSRHVTSCNQGTFSRWREDPGNEVEYIIVPHSYSLSGLGCLKAGLNVN